MATAKSVKPKQKPGGSENPENRIIEAYRDYILANGQAPPSVYIFCKDLGISEDQFYKYFNDFDQVGDAFWAGIFKEVEQSSSTEEEYGQYSVREKFLSFYYNFFEAMKKHRSYALLSFDDSILSIGKSTRNLSELRKEYKLWAKSLMDEGVKNQEIASRSMINDSYGSIFWYQFLFLINFWRKDKSKGFEKTDAAIEKSVHLSFDLIEKNALDSAIDFGKFLFQNK